MLMPSIFGENLFDDDWFDFDRDFWGRKNPLYGKNAKNIMKTDIREHDTGYELDVDLPGFWIKMSRIRKANTSARSVMPAQCREASM